MTTYSRQFYLVSCLLLVGYSERLGDSLELHCPSTVYPSAHWVRTFNYWKKLGVWFAITPTCCCWDPTPFVFRDVENTATTCHSDGSIRLIDSIFTAILRRGGHSKSCIAQDSGDCTAVSNRWSLMPLSNEEARPMWVESIGLPCNFFGRQTIRRQLFRGLIF